MNFQTLIINSPYWIRQIAINAYGFILSRKRFSGTFERYFLEFQDNLYKPQDLVEQKQLNLVKDNLIYCYENIEYYTRVFKENSFDPYKMKSLDELTKLPYLTKDIIRAEFENLYNKNIPKSKYKIHATSGSTGEKLRFLLPKELLEKKNTAFMYRCYSLFGVHPKDKRVTIGGRKFTNKRPFFAYNYFENQLLLSSHHLNRENLIEYLDEMNKFKPVFLQGHPSAILVLAKFILSANFKLKADLKAISTTGETLFREDKTIIEKAFNTSVYQQYGSGENCFSAQELPEEEGYLVNFEHGYIELIGNSEYKEVVVTSLQNNVMPFVRYKIGDYVLPSEKKFSEKYGLPIYFTDVIGRIDDVVTSLNGNEILPVTIRMNMKPFLQTGTNYQLIQKTNSTFLLNLLDSKKSIDVDEVMKMLKSLLGTSVQIEVVYVDNLTSLGGKIRNVINDNK